MLIDQLPQIVKEAADGLANANINVLNGADGLGEIAAGLVGQGLTIFDSVKRNMANGAESSARRRPNCPGSRTATRAGVTTLGGGGSAQRLGDFSDRRALGVAYRSPVTVTLLVRLGDVVGEIQDELSVLVDLLRGRLTCEQGHRIPQVLQAVLLQLIRRVVPGVVHRGFGGDDLVEQLALAMMLPRGRVDLGHLQLLRIEPPRCAVITIMPALGGPSSTSFHSSGVKSAFAVISSSAPRWLVVPAASVGVRDRSPRSGRRVL